MNPVRIGVIGCGVMGRRHVHAGCESPAVEITAVADVRREAAAGLAEEYEVARVFDNASDLIRHDSVEAVVLAMPAGIRTPLALEAFAAGKHVLVEKPVATNADEVREMIAAKGRLVGACCSSRFRFFDSAGAAEALLRSGELGALRVVRCRGIVAAGPRPKTPPPAWRLSRRLNGGGILSNWGCYDLDYLLGITSWSLQPREVFASMWGVSPLLAEYVAEGSDAETHVTAHVQCDGGTVIQIERAEYTVAAPRLEWEIVGENGSLELQMTPGAGKENHHYTLNMDTGVASQVLWRGDERWELTHARPIDDFARAIQRGEEPKTSLERALLVQRITDAIYRSAREGRSVSLDTV